MLNKLALMGQHSVEVVSNQSVCGWFNRPDLTTEAYYKEYFRTGDMGKLDNDGFLYFMERKKELIISGGINIFPSDIEAVIVNHDSVTESAVFPFPDDNLEEVVAVALVSSNSNEFNLRTLRHYCAKHLADFQQPRKYFIVDKLPKNDMGKLTKHILIKKYCSHV